MIWQGYDPLTGEILETRDTTEDIVAIMRANGMTLIQGEGSDLTHYVDIAVSPPVVKEKPSMTIQQDKVSIAANGEDYFMLAGLPVPCIVSVNDKSYTVNDGVFEWATLRPGVYRVLVSAFPYLDYEGQVIAE